LFGEYYCLKKEFNGSFRCDDCAIVNKKEKGPVNKEKDFPKTNLNPYFWSKQRILKSVYTGI